MYIGLYKSYQHLFTLSCIKKQHLYYWCFMQSFAVRLCRNRRQTNPPLTPDSHTHTFPLGDVPWPGLCGLFTWSFSVNVVKFRRSKMEMLRAANCFRINMNDAGWTWSLTSKDTTKYYIWGLSSTFRFAVSWYGTETSKTLQYTQKMFFTLFQHSCNPIFYFFKQFDLFAN